MIRLSTTAVFALSLLLTTVIPAMAAVTAKVLETKIAAAKILPANEKIQVSSQGDEALVSKFKIERSKNPDRDSKIEAVLLAKIIMDNDPSIKKVRTGFFDKKSPTNFSSITVRIGDIKSFASGSISQVDLLGSLDLVQGTDASTDMKSLLPGEIPVTKSSEPESGAQQVEAGPLADERKALIGRIKQLQKSGINTSAYESYFASIEDAAKKDDAKNAKAMIEKLTQNVESQETAIQRKKEIASGATGGDDLDDFGDVQYSGSLDSALQKAFPKLAKLAMSSMAVPMSQAFKPKQGPYYFERLSLAGHWNTYGGGDRKLFMELEQAAKTNDPRLPRMVQGALTKYSISPQMVEFSKRIYALKKSQQR